MVNGISGGAARPELQIGIGDTVGRREGPRRAPGVRRAAACLRSQAMKGRPLAVSVNEPVGTVGDDIVVVLLSAELWARRVVLHFGVIENAATDALLAEYEELRQRSRHTSREGALLWFADFEAFEKITVELSDSEGRSYANPSRQVGGTGTEWSASWLFEPAPAAGVFTLAVTSPAGVKTLTITAEA
jgi:hypothetical protein